MNNFISFRALKCVFLGNFDINILLLKMLQNIQYGENVYKEVEKYIFWYLKMIKILFFLS